MSSQPVKIIISGPESTGKSSLAQSLASSFNGKYIPEYARVYVQKLKNRYTYTDVEHIAKMQYNELLENNTNNKQDIFYDTGLIITKIWFEVVFKMVPVWISKAIVETKPDLYLLCNTDIEWKADKLRENPGEMREQLYTMYENELQYYRMNYKVISGTGEERFQAAVSYVNMFKLINNV